MKPTLKRQHIVQTTLNDAEMSALRRQAEKEGVTPTAFLRQLVIRRCSPIQEQSAESS